MGAKPILFQHGSSAADKEIKSARSVGPAGRGGKPRAQSSPPVLPAPPGLSLATNGAMCASRKQGVNRVALLAALFAAAASPALAGGRSAGGIALGESHGGIADQAYVIAPPHWLYVVEKEPGSFLDCGEGRETRKTDAAGRDAAELTCGVTLTETIVIPAASTSARLIVHY